MKFSILIILCLTPIFSQGTEVDQFTSINAEIKDSRAPLNVWFNHALDFAIVQLNKKNRSCSKDFLFENITLNMGLHNWAAFEHELNTSHPEVDRAEVPNEKSIYKGVSKKDAPVVWSGLGCCAPVLNVNGIRIGSDKLGHFFSQGLAYYTDSKLRSINQNELLREHYGIIDAPKVVDKSKSVGRKRAVLFSTFEEDGLYGLKTNGTKSYADIAAGYDGYLFWSSFYGEKNSLVKCENGKFKRTGKQFDWGEWVSKAWDESINCSEFTDNVQKLVSKNISVLEKSMNRKLSCPVAPEACADLSMRYIEVYRYVLNPKCRDFSRITKFQDSLKLLKPKTSCQQ